MFLHGHSTMTAVNLANMVNFQSNFASLKMCEGKTDLAYSCMAIP